MSTMPKESVRLSQLGAVPNLLSLLRIVLIPLFAWRYLTARSPEEFLFASAILAASGVTDLLDGAIARKFHMITPLGKILDPVADKLTHLTILLCVAVRYPLFFILFTALLLKETLMLIGGVLLLRRRVHPGGAKWFGKLATFVLDVSMIVVVMAPALPPAFVTFLCVLNMIFAVFVLYHYILVFFQLRKEILPRRQSGPSARPAGFHQNKEESRP